MNAFVDSQIDTPPPSVIALWSSGPHSQAVSVLAAAPLTCALRRGSTILHGWLQSKPDGYLSVQYIKAPGRDGDTKECDAEGRGPRGRERALKSHRITETEPGAHGRRRQAPRTGCRLVKE